MGNVGDQERAFEVNLRMERREAEEEWEEEERMSYRVKVRSVPIEARTEGSEGLNLREVMVSVEVGNVRLDMAALLF